MLSFPRKQGKTTLAAALALCHLLGPEAERRGQVFSAASDREQSAIVFRELEAIILSVPEFLSRCNIQSFTKTISDTKATSGVNIGAGTITCNYDGTNKHRTIIEDGVFIGSDTQLVAPVRIGKGAYIGAGSTITKDVPPGSLAVSRAEQRTIKNWGTRRRAKGKGQKAQGSSIDGQKTVGAGE